MDVTRTTTRMAEPMADKFWIFLMWNFSLIRTTVLLDAVWPWCCERRKFISNYTEHRSSASPHIFLFCFWPLSISPLPFLLFFLSLCFNHGECFWSAALSTCQTESMRDDSVHLSVRSVREMVCKINKLQAWTDHKLRLSLWNRRSEPSFSIPKSKSLL